MIILSALLLDFLAGDPRWLPHPVRGIGLIASTLESITRAIFGSSLRIAGIITAVSVIGICGMFSWTLIKLLNEINQIAGSIAGVLIIYFSIAPRDLYNHSNSVRKALKSGSIETARKKVAMIVGRDVNKLDKQEIVRASVETVAESLVDGVTAPLFYAILFGPTGAFVYRAINTLDSMFGHKNEKYFYFGWAPARIDDIANFIPARLSQPFIALSAIFMRLDFFNCLKVLFRDGHKHHSPNSGLSEAAFAGALNIQLGGLNYYEGVPDQKPLIGDNLKELTIEHVQKANNLMFLTTFLFTATGAILLTVVKDYLCLGL